MATSFVATLSHAASVRYRHSLIFLGRCRNWVAVVATAVLEEKSSKCLVLLVPQEGFEPPAHALRMRCSTPELLRPYPCSSTSGSYPAPCSTTHPENGPNGR